MPASHNKKKGKAIAFSSLDTTHALLADLPAADRPAITAAAAHQRALTKPPKSLGRLEDLALWLAGWQATATPRITAPQCIVFAGNHGVAAAHAVSAYPTEVTAQMVANFTSGGAAINQLTAALAIPLAIHPLSLETPTADITRTAAMPVADTLAAMQAGADAVPTNCDLLLLGEMGIGNTTIAAALAMAILGGSARDWAGPGTGLDAKGIAGKADIIAAAVRRHRQQYGDGQSVTDSSPSASDSPPSSPVAYLASLGGRELAAIAGATLAARHRRLPVLLDGVVATAACLPLWHANATALAHCQISHLSAEPAHAKMLAAMDMQPLMHLDMRLGEASGAAVAFGLVKLALAVHNGMASFATAGVSTATRHQ